MRIGEESLPPRFGISDLPPDSGDVTLDTCDDAIPYFVMDRKGRRTLPKARAGLGWQKQVRRVAGRRQASLEEETRNRKVAHAPSRVDA